MKKLFAVVAAAMLMVGVAGQAMADFELGELQLVAYVEADNDSLPVGTDGNEVHFDLGAGLFDLTSDIDTDITLDDIGATSWDEVYVAIVGGGYTSSFGDDLAYFSSDTADFSASTAAYQQFQGGMLAMSSLMGQTEIQSKATGSYYASMLMEGNAAGTYAGMVDANSLFGAETQMNGDLADAAMYTFDAMGTGDIVEEFAFSFDTTGSTLVLTASEVPVPAAVWLMGSGLLGLIGLRRKNA